MSYFDSVKIKDANGNIIHSSTDADGDYHLSTALIQEIISSTLNITTTNLAVDEEFVGEADETYGISGIQIYHYCDRPCIVIIEQSIDSINWDIIDTYDIPANTGWAKTVVSVAPYYRAKVQNDGISTTTALRFATGMTPIINPLPRSLSDDDRLKTESTLMGDYIIDANSGVNLQTSNIEQEQLMSDILKELVRHVKNKQDKIGEKKWIDFHLWK